MKMLFHLVCMLIFCSACKTDPEFKSAGGYFAFGTAYGFCQGDCATFYCIKDGQLYADDMDKYGEPLKFKKDPLPVEKYMEAKPLLDEFPAYFKAHAGETLGCPDCRDQGSIYIEHRLNGVTTRWHLDTDTSSLPVEIRNYVSNLLIVAGHL